MTIGTLRIQESTEWYYFVHNSKVMRSEQLESKSRLREFFGSQLKSDETRNTSNPESTDINTYFHNSNLMTLGTLRIQESTEWNYFVHNSIVMKSEHLESKSRLREFFGSQLKSDKNRNTSNPRVD